MDRNVYEVQSYKKERVRMAAKQVQSFRSIGRKRTKGENPSIQELVPIKK